jgi:hypothetical protein
MRLRRRPHRHQGRPSRCCALSHARALSRSLLRSLSYLSLSYLSLSRSRCVCDRQSALQRCTSGFTYTPCNCSAAVFTPVSAHTQNARAHTHTTRTRRNATQVPIGRGASSPAPTPQPSRGVYTLPPTPLLTPPSATGAAAASATLQRLSAAPTCADSTATAPLGSSACFASVRARARMRSVSARADGASAGARRRDGARGDDYVGGGRLRRCDVVGRAGEPAGARSIVRVRA